MTSQPSPPDQEIDALQQTLAATPPGHPERVRLLADLAQALRRRFDRSGDVADLDAAITHLQEALTTIPADHADRRRLLVRLGDALVARFRRTHDHADLTAAWGHLRDGGVPQEELRRRFKQTGGSVTVIGDFAEWEVATPPDPDTLAPPPPAESTRAPRPAPDPWPAPAGPPPADARPPLPSYGGPAAPGGPPPVAGGVPSTRAQPGVPTPQAATPAADRRLEFAAAYRRVIEQERRYPVLFFVHRPAARDLVRALIDRRAAQLGGTPAVSQASAARAIESGTTLTIVPNVLGARFEPSSIDVIVDDAVRELTFQMTVAPESPLGVLDGYIDIFVGPLIIGQVSVGFDVHAFAPVPVPVQSPSAQFLTVANASIFDRIFVSYSRRDSAVVDLCVSTYEGLGVEVLIDKLDLRSGDDWRDALENMINQSDIFQLYWSSSAAASQEVGHEWRVALALSKTRDRFIRPLYWETPIPSLPEALGHLHFSRLDLKVLRRAAKAYAPVKPGRLRRMIASVLGSQ